MRGLGPKSRPGTRSTCLSDLGRSKTGSRTGSVGAKWPASGLDRDPSQHSMQTGGAASRLKDPRLCEKFFLSSAATERDCCQAARMALQSQATSLAVKSEICPSRRCARRGRSPGPQGSNSDLGLFKIEIRPTVVKPILYADAVLWENAVPNAA